jgi:ferredoxin--NADP+ reductase
VAPDHPKIKSVIRVYEKIAGHPAFRFFGGVELGADVDRADLLERYHAVVYAFGTATDRRLGIPGEDLVGSHSATDFVGWYNGHPDFCDHAFDLQADRAVVVGNGNVAIDVARMLVLAADELAPTDTADHALEAFGGSAIREVVLLGRRGPVQAAFTTPELLELGELERADVIVEPFEAEVPEDASGTVKRNVEVLQEYASRTPQGRSHRIALRFLRSPLEVLGDEHGRVRGLRVAVNRLEDAGDGRVRAVPTGEEEVIDCGLVFRAVGYRGRPLGDVPFDEELGRIPNVAGRVTGPDGATLTGEYAVGWIKRGPSGVIGTNKKDAAETVARLLEDAEAGRLNAPADPDPERTEAWLRERVPHLATWAVWQAIDEHERRAGEAEGRPRRKVVRHEELRKLGR